MISQNNKDIQDLEGSEKIDLNILILVMEIISTVTLKLNIQFQTLDGIFDSIL
jgi:hypothetical protein